MMIGMTSTVAWLKPMNARGLWDSRRVRVRLWAVVVGCV